MPRSLRATPQAANAYSRRTRRRRSGATAVTTSTNVVSSAAQLKLPGGAPIDSPEWRWQSRLCATARWAPAQPHLSGELVFDHVKFGVSDYAASREFFLKALEPLGVVVVSEGPPAYGVELSPKGKASSCLFQTEEKPAHLHLAVTAENRRQVDAFHRAALEAGARDNGAPGLRPQYSANYYAAFVIGPDGHNIEVVCHEPEP